MDKGVALNPRLAVLLELKNKGGAMWVLERRLARLQRRRVKQRQLLQEVGAEKKLR
jgi:hypothetical protein